MRDTILIQAGKVNFKVKSYATAREHQAIQQSYFKGTKLEVVGDQPKISEFNPSIQFEVEKEMINQMVIAIEGDESNIVEKCLDLPHDVYKDLVTQLDGIVSKKKS